ncbi:MAG: DUF2239 family protein [Rhizobacter sp.]
MTAQPAPATFTVFDGAQRIASGPLAEVALAAKRAIEADATGPVLIFDDASGKLFDLSTRGSDDAVLLRAAQRLHGPGEPTAEPATDEPRGRGRPKLGVTAREVTLLPRHWDWLATQPGGASVALRKLVEAARRQPTDHDLRRQARERAYHFMSALAGNLPGFEEATRALFADNTTRLRKLTSAWPRDVREHLFALASNAAEPAVPS